MAPEIQAVVRTTQAWLQSSWHVQVPFTWLEACVEWLQEEAGGAGRLSQQQINQQALDQWLLTDLRDLDYPVLPEGLAQAQKTELSGTFCVQVDSLLDISQPAYGQLQKLRGTDCSNDEVSAVTQVTQRPWEARTSRMLLLQNEPLISTERASTMLLFHVPTAVRTYETNTGFLTDGVQSLEAMEYQSIPALSADLRPGVKLQLRGQMVCRLGVILLGPSHVQLLGGEVEDLVDRNNQGKMLCRTLGLPEEEQQQQVEEAPPAPQQGTQEFEDVELDDTDLLASLEAQEQVERAQVGPVRDSGYGTLSETSTQSSRSSSVRSLVSTASSRSGLTLSDRGGSVGGHRQGNEQEDSDMIQQEIRDHNMADEDFPDEDFDDLPLDELDAVVFQESSNLTDSSLRPQTNSRIPGNLNRATNTQSVEFELHTLTGSGSLLSSRSTSQKRDYQGCARGATGQFFSASRESECVANDESNFMHEDMDCFLEEEQTGGTGGPKQLSVQIGPTNKTDASGSSCRLTPQGQNYTSGTAESDPQSHSCVPSLTLTSPPFTYLCLLEEKMSKPHFHTTEIRVKAFIVTLLGKLSSSNGFWRVCATISDGTGYLDVELSDEVLKGLLGFSVAEKGALKRDPARRGELDSGMRRCQEELVDMCCIMNIVVEPEGKKAVVTKADPVNEKVLQELEPRVRDRRK